MEERAADVELVAVAQRATDDPTQHVAAIFVARRHAIGNQKRARTNVVGNHAHRRIRQADRCDRCRRFRRPRASGSETDRSRSCVCTPCVIAATRSRPMPVSTPGFRQRRQRAVGRTIELRKHEIPELDESITVLVRRTRRTARRSRDRDRRRSRVHGPHGPVSPIAQKLSAIGTTRFGSTPIVSIHNVARLIVVGMHRHPQPLARNLQLLRDELPRPADRVFLEIVGKTEVAHHFEERVMTRRVADVLEIVVFAARAHAALRRRRALEAGILDADQRIFELHHAGIREQQRVVAGGYERTRRHHAVSALPQRTRGISNECQTSSSRRY